MLEATKADYINTANLLVPNWKSINKNKLVILAIENMNTSSYDGYIAALMLKYWGKLSSYCNKCKLVATPEDVHTWLVKAVMYAIERHPWTNENSSIYNDKNGPDKVINRVMESKRLTFYQQLNRYNRKINSLLLSIESLSEDWADANTPTSEDEHTSFLDDLVIHYFDMKDYFYAFILDALIYENYSLHTHTKRLVTHMLSINESYCDIFAGRYNIDINRVIRASSYITRMNRINLNIRIESAQKELAKRFKSLGILNVNRAY